MLPDGGTLVLRRALPRALGPCEELESTTRTRSYPKGGGEAMLGTVHPDALWRHLGETWDNAGTLDALDELAAQLRPAADPPTRRTREKRAAERPSPSAG